MGLADETWARSREKDNQYPPEFWGYYAGMVQGDYVPPIEDAYQAWQKEQEARQREDEEAGNQDESGGPVLGVDQDLNLQTDSLAKTREDLSRYNESERPVRRGSETSYEPVNDTWLPAVSGGTGEDENNMGAYTVAGEPDWTPKWDNTGYAGMNDGWLPEVGGGDAGGNKTNVGAEAVGGLQDWTSPGLPNFLKKDLTAEERADSIANYAPVVFGVPGAVFSLQYGLNKYGPQRGQIADNGEYYEPPQSAKQPNPVEPGLEAVGLTESLLPARLKPIAKGADHAAKLLKMIDEFSPAHHAGDIGRYPQNYSEHEPFIDSMVSQIIDRRNSNGKR
ncbi:MAG: hypothetical protein P4N41_16675 [Negativicutes bacterium]|nr:hypothetical protein [Negativicutes bacterium]MDR3591290.1 hypothetical protein [Negativicutes bacterium]